MLWFWRFLNGLFQGLTLLSRFLYFHGWPILPLADHSFISFYYFLNTINKITVWSYWPETLYIFLRWLVLSLLKYIPYLLHSQFAGKDLISACVCVLGSQEIRVRNGATMNPPKWIFLQCGLPLLIKEKKWKWMM